jgi:hypothetical protein
MKELLSETLMESGVDCIPVDDVHVGIDVLRSGGLEVEEVGMLVDVEGEDEG